MYKEKKKFLWLPVFVLTLLFAIIFTNHVFSSSEIDMKIKYNEDTWDLSKAYPFDKEWVTTEEQVTLTVDLSTYYKEMAQEPPQEEVEPEPDPEPTETLAENSEETPTQPDPPREDPQPEPIPSQPFEIEAKFGEEQKSVAANITPIKAEDGTFSGSYQVVVNNLENDGTLAIDLSILETNEWGISTQQNPIEFEIIKDTVSPSVTISGVEDGVMYHANSGGKPSNPTMNIEVVDKKLIEKNIVITKNGEPVDPPTDWDKNGNSYTTDYTFTDDGAYQVNVSAGDIAGNQAAKDITFYVHNEEPELTVSSDGKQVENNKSVNTNAFLFELNNTVPIERAQIEVTKDGSDYENIGELQVEGNQAKLNHTFSQDGTYQVTVSLTDAHGGETHQLETFTFSIDRTAPELTITDKDGNQLKEKYDQPIDIVIKAEDSKLDDQDTTLEITREDFEGTKEVDVDLDFEDGVATANVSLDTDGIYTIKLQGKDTLSNSAELTKEVTMFHDSLLINMIDLTNGAEVSDYYNHDVKIYFEYWNFKFISQDSTFSVKKLNEDTGEMEAYLTNDDINRDFLFNKLTHTFGEGKYVATINTFGYSDDAKTVTKTFVVDSTDPTINFDSKVAANDHLTSKYINEQTAAVLFPITVNERNLASESVTVTHVNSEGDEITLTGEQVGTWSQVEGKDNTRKFSIKENLFEENGEYTINVEAEDESGRTSSKSVTFIVDNIKPIIRLSDIDSFNNEALVETVEVEESNFASNKVTINVLKQDDDGKFVVYESDAFKEWENKQEISKLDFPFEEDGKYKIVVDAIDKAGNLAEQKSDIFTIDKVKPQLSIDGVTNNEHYNQTKQAEIKVNDKNIDKNSTVVKVDKYNHETNQYEPYDIETQFEVVDEQATWSHSFAEEGTFKVELSATDMASNNAQNKVVAFTIDKTTPVLDISGVDDQSFNPVSKEVTVSVDETNFTENNVTFNVTKNGNDYTDEVEEKVGKTWKNANNQATLTYDFDNDGLYTIRLLAEDAAGNKAAVTERQFTIDTTQPSIAITGVEDGIHYDDSKTVAIEIEDVNFANNTVEVTKNGESYQVGELATENGKASLRHTFEEQGDYHITVNSIDKAGNDTKDEMTFTIDKTNPNVEVSKKIASFVTSEFIDKQGVEKLIPISLKELNAKDKSVSVTRTNLDGKETKFKESDIGSWKQETEDTYKFVIKDGFFAKDGDYSLEVTAVDQSGRTDKDTLSFTVDNIKPEINLTDIDDYNKQAETETVKVTEHNYSNNNVTINVYKENTKGEFVSYNNDAFKKWKNESSVSSLDFPFATDGKYKVVVNAEDAAGNKATTKTDIFTIDTIKPGLSITGVSDGEHYNTSKNASITVTDQNIDKNRTTLRVTKLNHATGKMETYKLAKQLDFSATKASLVNTFDKAREGTYRIQLDATDKAGNKAESIAVTFTIDKTAPVLSIDNVDDGAFYPASKQVNFGIDELNYQENSAQFSVTKDGQSFTDVVEGSKSSNWRYAAKVSNLRYNFNQDGSYTAKMSAKDAAGNVSKSQQKTFVIDTVNPTIDISGVDNDAYYNVDKPVTVTIKDVNFDVNTIRVTKDGASYNVGGFSVTTNRYQNSIASLRHNFSQEGDYEIVVEAVDKAGNSFQQQIGFTIDKTAPVITPMIGGENSPLTDGAYINHVFTPQFRLDKPDEDTIESVYLNGGSNLAGNVPMASKEMVYNYKVLATDKAGNQTTLEVGFTLDTTKPKLSISGVLEGFFNENIKPSVTYSDKYLDKDKTSVTLNGKPFENGMELDREQSYVLKAVITDLASNVSERTIVFTVDKTAPVIQFKEAISDKYLNETIIPELFIEDMSAYDIIALTLNGEAYNLGDPIEEEGKHVLFFEVKDKAGNIQQLTVEFIIDKTPPEIVFEGAEENGEYFDPIELLIRLSNLDDKIQTITVNGEEFEGEIVEEDGEQVIKLNLSDVDSYQVEVTAYDEAGNEVKKALPFEIAEKSGLVKLYENKPLFAGTIVGVLAALAAASTVVVRKRRNRIKPEEELLEEAE
ncbi:Ig-like domain-containing protein [Aquibacillus rhizosphaerae]|uniref:Ig-like domain-containing protein n=1 Tax=Aquibacillus rhizosphaerae TaxID=3051431 RepID=A0ABT7L1B4_9BACI|nr:Ig-like domain-containing protein [Aquibacillus sp. LR5S19]MDL4838925.1 Ig-like domain-containing protein [Aquibacillus sp. LR5S19]